MLHISGEQLRLWQLNELELVVEVDRICRKNGIKYSLDAGTLLGAIRHNGFIPWDDDADVVFSRDEYEKFFKACETELDKEKFFLQDYRTDENYRWGHNKMRLVGTEYIKEGQEKAKYKTGVCIDVLVYDNVPDGWIKRRLYYFYNFCIRKALYSELGKDNAGNAFLRGWYKLLYKIPRNWLFKMFFIGVKKVNRKTTKMKSHLLLHYPKPIDKFGMPAHCFNDYTEHEFEGMKLSVFSQYDDYLTAMYRDYMKLPPEDKRQTVSQAVELRLIDTSIEKIRNKYKQYAIDGK